MKRTLVYAHRGASRRAPENSCAALRLARELGADGVEMDLMLCASGEVVVFHDDTLGRMTGRPGSVEESTLAELRALDLGGGERIPTLEEAVEAAGPLLLNLELKCGRVDDRGLAAKVAGAIRALGIRERTLVSSFNPAVLARFRLMAPDVPVGFLFARDQAWHFRRGLWAPVVRASAVHPEASLCTEARVRRWHRRGYLVNVWTVDDPLRVAELARMGVDAIITNEPEVARRAVEAVTGEERSEKPARTLR